MSLVKRINLLCGEYETTFAEVERKCGLSNGSIRRWDTNTPSTDKLQKVADHFDVSTDYLLGQIPFRNEDEALTSISIASVKYVMHNRIEFDPHFADGCMDYYFDLLYESNYRLYKYIDRLVTMYDNKDSRISNLEYFELSNILFKDIKYSKNYDGLIYLTDFYGESGIVKLNFNEIPKFTKRSIRFHESLFYKIIDTKEDDYITHTSLFDTINTNNMNAVEVNELKQSFSSEAIEVAKAYDTAPLDKKTIVKLTLGVSSIHNDDNSYLLPNAAHEIEGASDEDKAHDDAIMDDDNF